MDLMTVIVMVVFLCVGLGLGILFDRIVRVRALGRRRRDEKDPDDFHFK